MKNLSYKEYYLRAIREQLQHKSFGGLKLVIGPTGMGKTSAIPDVIAYQRATSTDKRCIYTSHRHQLIREMKNNFKQRIPYVYLRNDEEVVKKFLTWNQKAEFLSRLEGYNFFRLAQTTKLSVEKDIESLQQIQNNLQQLKNLHLQDAQKQQRLVFQERGRKFLGLFKTGLAQDGLTEHQKEQLMQDEGIWRLFPYVEFLHKETRPVLLVSIHKLLYGFFNGRSHERILSLKDNIIFMDEFDVQEKEMLSFLSQSPEIQNSFEFISLFHSEMTRQQQMGYLNPTDNDSEPKLRAKQRAQKIVDDLNDRCQKEGLSFPRIRHFTLQKGIFDTNYLSVFQSGVQIMTNPFLIQENGLVWEVVKSGDNTQRARSLMRIIVDTVDEILDFFSGLQQDELVSEWESWIRQCYDRENDDAPGRYKEIIKSYSFYRRPLRWAAQQQPGATDDIYYRGYDFFRLKRDVYATSPDEVRVEEKRLTVTPEYLMRQLSDTNLVFALSATGDFKRYIQSFDMNWLERNSRYLPIDDDDTTLIADLKKQKEAKRSYQVKLDTANELPVGHTLFYALDQLEQEHFFQEENGNREQAVFYRKRALSLFLETLHWVIEKSQNQSHLVFLNSFRFVEKFFQPNSNGLPPSFYTSINQHIAFEVIDNRFREYMVSIKGQTCQIVFLDAAQGREMGDKSFKQIQSSIPLVVVTTYATASNGVNLAWYASNDDEEKKGDDFQSIHLLEAPHYYFSSADNNRDGVDEKKIFIWKIWKLRHNFQLSEAQFTTALRELNASSVNNYYKSTTDYLSNQIAAFHQALGRVDRQWKSMPPVEIRLSTGHSGVLEIFEQYLNKSGVIAEHRRVREVYTSSLILALYAAIEKHYLRRTIVASLQFESIAEREDVARETIDKLLRAISGVRRGDYAMGDAKKIMRLWQSVREALLKQDYHFEREIEVMHLPTGQRQLLGTKFQQVFVQESAFMQHDAELLIDWEARKVYRQATSTTQVYNLNRFYRKYAENSVIDWYFRARNYRLRYEPANQYQFFVPSVQQRLLAGAVGEAALKAALQHFGIPLVSEYDTCPELFEIADIELANLPIYVDAKNYSQWTILYRFAARPGDPDYDEKMNAEAFLKAAQRKWKYIVAQTGNKKTKLVFINMVAGEDHPNEGWDTHLNPVHPYHFADSAITIIQGVIQYDAPSEWRLDFKDWISSVKALYQL